MMGRGADMSVLKQCAVNQDQIEWYLMMDLITRA